MTNLRSNQRQILAYTSGRMGIAAVPGSGKTWTLAHLAADLLGRSILANGQELLVVTLVNSAVDHFYKRVRSFLAESGGQSVFADQRLRVRTLHGLAHDIVRERPALVGLDPSFQIIDERAAEVIRSDIVREWLQNHLYDLDDFIDPEMGDEQRGWARRERLPALVEDVGFGFIRYAKDLQLEPEALRQRLQLLQTPLPLAEMGCEIYAAYQRSLEERGAVDFDDLIRLALQALRSDADYLALLRKRWPYLLEDEAQDSSRLQEDILRLLAGPNGNWVRVGDPNQAIYETFTTASPRYLRAFLSEPGVQRHELSHSGRSTQTIIGLANYLVNWVANEHPLELVRTALQAPPWIEPAPDGDPQPNPPDLPVGVRFVNTAFGPLEEIAAVVDSVARWLPDHPDQTVAVLAPRNLQAFDLVDGLRRLHIPYEDSLLRSSSTTRFSAGALGNLLHYLSNPGSARDLAIVYRVWRRKERSDQAAQAEIERVAELLHRLVKVEDYLWPGPQSDWLDEVILPNEPPEIYESLLAFRLLVRRWQGAAALPVDQLVISLAQDLLVEPVEQALAHQLAGLLREASQANPTWRLPELAAELGIIARNERRFLGLSAEDTGFDPQEHKAEVVVATLHKAKGLEWDRVYLLSANQFDFPSGLSEDLYISEKRFIRDRLNLEAEAMAQLRAAYTTGPDHGYEEGSPSKQARLDYVRERLRLFYVGITRARRELVVTWNNGRRGDLRPALPFLALQHYLENQKL